VKNSSISVVVNVLAKHDNIQRQQESDNRSDICFDEQTYRDIVNSNKTKGNNGWNFFQGKKLDFSGSAIK